MVRPCRAALYSADSRRFTVVTRAPSPPGGHGVDERPTPVEPGTRSAPTAAIVSEPPAAQDLAQTLAPRGSAAFAAVPTSAASQPLACFFLRSSSWSSSSWSALSLGRQVTAQLPLDLGHLLAFLEPVQLRFLASAFGLLACRSAPVAEPGLAVCAVRALLATSVSLRPSSAFNCSSLASRSGCSSTSRRQRLLAQPQLHGCSRDVSDSICSPAPMGPPGTSSLVPPPPLPRHAFSS